MITLSALLGHLFELRVKMLLTRDDYQLVQRLDQSWQWLVIFEVCAILLTFTWAMLVRREKNKFPYVLSALTFFIISMAIFFIFTFPTNQATRDWTKLPDDWIELRKTWEYSHAVRAILNLTGFMLLMIALILKRQHRSKQSLP